MSIRIEEVGTDGIAIVLGERFDFQSVGPFRQSYESLKNVTGKVVVIDFRDTRYIDSSALGMLINAKSFFDAQSTKIKLQNTSDQVKKIFSLSRFDKKFDIS